MNARQDGFWMPGRRSAGGGNRGYLQEAPYVLFGCLRRELDIYCELRFTYYFGDNSPLCYAKLERSVKLAFFDRCKGKKK